MHHLIKEVEEEEGIADMKADEEDTMAEAVDQAEVGGTLIKVHLRPDTVGTEGSKIDEDRLLSSRAGLGSEVR